MSSTQAMHPFPRSLSTRSLGAKFFLVVLLALGMSLSGVLVQGLTIERADRYGLRDASTETPSFQPKTVLGIRLADSYRSTRRSLHYITLFLGLVFLTYFLFEATTGKRVHPAQYVLVGIAQTIFYLLLLSLSEHLGFDLSFLIAGASTVALFSWNTEWVFRSRKLALRSFAVFTAVYGFIYILLRIEAFALLIGAIASFVAVAAAMYLTRNVDWYRNDGAFAGSAGATGAPVRESWLD